MPELPDLLYLRTALEERLKGRTVIGITIKEPVVIRSMIDSPWESLLSGTPLTGIRRQGPFLILAFADRLELVVNLMLAGRFHLLDAGDPLPGWLILLIEFDDGTRLALADSEKMAKVYCTRPGAYEGIPRLLSQGVDILSPGFTPDLLLEIATRHRRKQVRVFINDQTILSAIGNAYADEVLFEAGIHPKTLVASLGPEAIRRLHSAIRDVMAWGAAEVARAGEPVQAKVRSHLRVRNRKGEPCPRCGTTIRREGVRGHDVFFCPRCQPATRSHFIEWRNLPGPKGPVG